MTMKAAYLHFSDSVWLLINECMCLEKTNLYPWKYIRDLQKKCLLILPAHPGKLETKGYNFITIKLLAIFSKVSWQTLHL